MVLDGNVQLVSTVRPWLCSTRSSTSSVVSSHSKFSSLVLHAPVRLISVANWTNFMEFLTIKPKIWYRWAWIFKMNLENSSEQKLKSWKMQRQRSIWMDLERRRVHHHLIEIIAIQDWVTTTFPSLFKSNWAQQLVRIKDSSLKASQDLKMMPKPFSHTKRKSRKKSTQQQKKVLKSNLNMKKF